jgi:TonB-dependent Receptor Plug Domain
MPLPKRLLVLMLPLMWPGVSAQNRSTQPVAKTAGHSAVAVIHQPRRARVIDSLSGAPIPGVRLRFPDVNAERRTDSTGSFTWPGSGLPAWVYATRIGFRGRLLTPSPTDSTFTIMLVPLPPMLDRVVVEEEALPGWLRREGRNRDLLDARRGGRLLLRADIERRGAVTLAQALERVPGLKVDGDYVFVPRAERSSLLNPCTSVVVYLDGERLAENRDINSIIRPSELEAIEVFVGPASVPRSLAGPRSGCGVIALWSKR